MQDPRVAARLDLLKEGDELRLLANADNTVNPRAIHIADGGGIPVGWVPDLLLDYIHELAASNSYNLRVQHINGPGVPSHLRLLVRVSGYVPTGFEPFLPEIWGPVD